MRGLTFLGLLIASVVASAPTRGQTASASLDGNLYVAQVLKNLQQHGNIDAKLRFESSLYDQKLVGQGSYQQGGDMNKRFTRWEMQTQIADQTASFVEVYDGDHLWTERRMPSKRDVKRLDVARLQSSLKTLSRGSKLTPHDALISSVTGQGGLSEMLADLLRHYTFQPPQPTQLNGLPVYSLVGTWRTEQLAKHWSASVNLDALELAEWPTQLPHHVLLLVHKQNLFPCVVEHRSAASSSYATSLAGLRPTSSPLTRYEIYEVNFAVAIPNEHFDFSPDGNWSDETSVVLERLKKEIEPAELSAKATDEEVLR